MLAGCIALRPIQERQCEIKRLYVRPQFRGQHLGRFLLQKVIVEAQNIGYHQVFLDTLKTMTVAQNLYDSMGFREIQPYCLNPVSGAVFMCLDL
jgi:ribosomal protein S18 acetylase RimI-like enzyme